MNSISHLKASFLAAFFLVYSFVSFGQQVENQPNSTPVYMPKNIIKIAPFAFIHGQVPFTVESRIGYERVISPKSSIAGSYSHLGTNPVFGFIGSVALSATLTTVLNVYGKPGKAGLVLEKTTIEPSGFRYQFQYKKYFGKNATAPEGLYLSPHFSYSEATYRVEFKNFDIQTRLEMKNRNYNLLFGYQGILGKHFVFDVFTGLGYKQLSTDVIDTNGVRLRTIEGSPLKVSSGFNMGWAF